MSFRGGGRSRGSRGRVGGRGRGRGGRIQDFGPPEQVVELGEFFHSCEEDLVCKCSNEKVPFFNAPVFLDDKSQIGKVDDIFGPINSFYFSVKLGAGMNATSFNKKQKFFIDPAKLLPLSRFLPKPPGQKGPRGGVGSFGRGRGGRGGGRGSRGGRGRGRGNRSSGGGRGGRGFRGRGRGSR
ncbi:H/ACA ribonucleoprotein complex subunit 1-like [Xenia sp. Carnegie-2017]|uniref:H/ACA ribonucleoprotein complex subunit 1-like n=1 Tax=Xenia sp. Carnegie-2017 TaxID=2897299 RepID=UPI001F048F09|nr:H/ACA ribonucleoprotein complex subunit 1-like [Xenia sp. Carnegie-2017]